MCLCWFVRENTAVCVGLEQSRAAIHHRGLAGKNTPLGLESVVYISAVWWKLFTSILVIFVIWKHIVPNINITLTREFLSVSVHLLKVYSINLVLYFCKVGGLKRDRSVK